MSPDLTVAYVDFLFDEGPNSPERPLNHIGQPRFPITLRICGLGTYFSPWYIDTNDVVMHAISQSHEIGVFIDKAWVNFIVELNNRLKTVRIHRIHRDLPRLLQFLNDERMVGSLGGIIVLFCSFISKLHETATTKSTEANSLAAQEEGNARSERSLELPETKLGELTEFSTVSQQLPGTFLGFFSDHKRHSGDSTGQKAGSGSAEDETGRFTFGRNSTMLKKNYFSDMFGLDEDQGAAAAPRKRAISRSGMSPSDQNDMDTLHKFSDVCDAVASGLRLPGIVIFHESTPLAHVIENELIDVVMEPTWAKKESRDEGDPDGNSLVSIELADNARQAYGERADELAKFYKIVRTADKTVENHVGVDSDITSAVTDKSVGPPVDKPVGDSMTSEFYHSDDDNSSDDNHSGEDTHPSPLTGRSSRPRCVSFSPEDGALSVEMVASSTTNALEDIKESRTDVCHPLSGEHTRGKGDEDHAMSSGHLYPVAVWKWGEGNKAIRLTLNEETKESEPSRLFTVFYMVIARLGLRELARDMKGRRPVFIGMDEKTAQRAYVSEVIITSVALASRLFCNGRNQKPMSTTFRRIVGLVLCLFNVADIALSCFISINLWCIWGDSTECDNQSGFILSMLIWPGALVLAPLYGLYAVILTPNGRFARQYSCWSRLAFFSLITLYSVYLSFVRHAPLEVLWYLLALTASRVMQIVLVDLFIACHENRRVNRGWDGLFTNIVRDEFYFE